MPLTLASALHKYFAKFSLFIYLLCITNLILKTSCCPSQLQRAAATKFTDNFMCKAKLKIPCKGTADGQAEQAIELQMRLRTRKKFLLVIFILSSPSLLCPHYRVSLSAASLHLVAHIFLKFDLAACRTCASLIVLLQRIFIIYSVIWQVSKCICTSRVRRRGRGNINIK